MAGRFANPWIPLALLGITLAALLAALFLHRSLANLRRDAETQTRQNERNQEAILRLLDELSSLADGDLTVQATVTEDITGAIADSINYAIEALRELVTTINDSAITLDGATRQTQALPTHLAKASSRSRSRSRSRPNRSRPWPPRPRKCPATPSAPRTSRATRSTSRTRAARPCAARSTA